MCLFYYSNSTGQRLDALESDVSVLKTDVSQIKVGGVALLFVFVGTSALSFTEMKEIEKRTDAKMIAAEAKSDEQLLDMNKKTDRMFVITTLVAIVPLLMSYYSNK